MKKTPLAVGALLAAILALAGCSAPVAPGKASGGPVTLNWTTWAGSEAETASWQHLADLVHKKDPKITVKLQTSAWPDYWTKMPTLLQGNDAPCIVGMQMAHVPAFADSLVPMDDKLAASGVSLSDFDKGIIKTLKSDGKQMALPYDFGPYLMFYNKDLFAGAGVTEPQTTWKIAEFLADAKKLTNGKTYGFALTNAVDAVGQWGPTLVGKQAADSSGKLDVDTSSIAKVVNWYSGLVHTEHVAAPVTSSTQGTDGQAFLAGNAAMYVDGPWAMINIKAQAKFNVGVVTVPAGPKGPATVTAGSGFAITKKCANPDAAMKAISLLTGPEALGYLGTQGRAYPARPDQQATWYKAAVTGSQTVLETANRTSVPYYSTPNWDQVFLNWQQGSVPVINGDAPAGAFLKNVQQQSATQ